MIKLKHVKLFEDYETSIDSKGLNKHKIKVTKCNNPMFWYNNYINQEFDVIEDNSGTKWNDGKEKWKVVPDNRMKGSVNYINKEDTKLVK